MSRIILISVLVIALFFIGCERSVVAPPNHESGSSITFSFEKPTNLDSLVVFAKAMVSAPDMDTIVVDLTVYPNSVEGSIENISAGPHRKFEIFTYDVDTTLTYYGHAFADVPAAQVITLQVVLYPVDHTGTVIVVGTFAQFPPSGEKIVFRANYTGMFDIYIMNPDASGIMNLTNTPNDEERYARISPDRQKIAFIRGTHYGPARPYLMDIDGTNETHLNIQPGSRIGYCDWAPFAEQLVFFSDNDGDNEIYTYDFNTGNTTQLTFDGENVRPQWSPTGNWISYDSKESGIFKIKLIQPDGNGDHLLLPNSGLEEKYAAFSPDGNKILFYGRDASTWDLFIVNTNGTNLARLTNTPGINENYGCWSPNGQEILFTKADGSSKGLYIFGGGAIRQLLDDPTGEEDWAHWR